MYQNHVPYIAGAMQADPNAFARGAIFAILSIQQQLVTVPKACADVERNADQSRFLFGHKAGAYRYITAHKAQLHASVCAAQSPEETIVELCKVPGLGIVKAAFIAQLMGHDVACLDTRNIQRDGLNPRAFRSDGEKRKTTRAFVRKITRYVRDTQGRAQELWDTWCIDVATSYGLTPMLISKIHLDCIVRESVTPIAVPLVALSVDMPF